MEKGKELSICFGVPSWLPSKEPARGQRIDRLNRMFHQVHDLFGDVEWIVIAQNWQGYRPPEFIKDKYIIRRPQLGILGARKELRSEFLKSGFDYIVMLDDDCIIESKKEDCSRYVDEIQKHPDGFCFLQYENAQLNLCAISRSIYQREPMVNINAQKDDGFEDIVFAYLLHYKYPDNEFHVEGIRCTQFQNQNEVAPSTWADSTHDYDELRRKSMYHISRFKIGDFSVDKKKASMYLLTSRKVEKMLWNGWITKEQADAMLDKYLH